MIGRMIVFSPDSLMPSAPRDLIDLIDIDILRIIRDAVGGGWLETVPYWRSYLEPGGKPVPCFAFCDEDGKRKRLPVNVAANYAWAETMRRDGAPAIDDVLVGPVVIVTGDAEFMESL